MSNQVALERLEQQAVQLLPQEQLELVAYISQQLSVMPFVAPMIMNEKSLRRQREKEAGELLALCDAAAKMWEGDFDAAEDIRQMRWDRKGRRT